MSGFGEILERLVLRVPGALAAIFADGEGESVGHFTSDSSTQSALDTQIAGAQWGVVWAQLGKAFGRAALGVPEELVVDGERVTVLLRGVADSYYVVLTVQRGTHLQHALDELSRSASELRTEMD